MTSPIDLLVERKTREQTLRSAGVGARLDVIDTDPDKVAEARRASASMGRPDGLGDIDPDGTIARARAEERQRILKANPLLADWLRDPRNANVGHDDIVALAQAGQTVGAVGGVLNAGERGVRRVGTSYDAWRLGRAAEVALDRDRSFGDIVSDASGPDGFPNPVDLVTAAGRYAASRLTSSDRQAAEVANRAGVLAESTEALQAVPMSAPSAALMERLQAHNTFGGVLGELASNPLSSLMLTTEVFAESLPPMAAGVAATAATRSPTIGALLMGAGSGSMEGFQEFADSLTEMGVDLSSPDGVRAILDDPALMEAAQDRGMTRGLIIGLADVLAGGVAGQSLSRSGALDAFYQSMVQAGLGSGGEAGAQVALDGEVTSPADIVLEGLAEVMSTPVDVLGVGGRAILRQRNAQAQADAIQRATDAAVASKLRQRSPEAFEAYIKAAVPEGADHVFIPAQAFNQPGFEIDPFDLGVTTDEMLAAREADHHLAVPLEKAISWGASAPERGEWLRTNATVDEGGSTLAEADRANAEIGTLVREEAERLRVEAARTEGERSADQQVLDDVARALVGSGRVNRAEAEHQASLVAARYRVLADMLTEERGDVVSPWDLYRERTGGLEVVNDVPGALRDRIPTDQLDSVFDDIRAGVPDPERGRSLLQAIRRYGGVIDDGGELAAMDAPAGVVRRSRKAEGQGALIGGMGNPDADYMAETVFEQMVDDGYFPEYRGQDVRQLPARDILLEAIGEELAGNPRYSDLRVETAESARRDDLAQWADYLDQIGLDLSSLTNEEARALLAERQAEGVTAYRQAWLSDVVAKVRRVVGIATKDKTSAAKEALFAVPDWLSGLARDRAGLDVAGHQVALDAYAVRHVLGRHGDEAAETARGNLPVSEADFEALPDVIDDPDQIVLGLKNQRGQDLVVFLREMPDGSTLAVSEVRTGRREVALSSMRRYPGRANVTAIIASLTHNVRNALPGDAPIVVSRDEIVKARAEAGPASYEQSAYHGSPHNGDTIMVDGVERSALNSNGARIAETVEGLQNFWRWFGASKVVDDQGRPLVVYHGTRNANFSRDEFAFDRSALGTNTNAPSARQGFFFAGTQATAGSASYTDHAVTEGTQETLAGNAHVAEEILSDLYNDLENIDDEALSLFDDNVFVRDGDRFVIADQFDVSREGDATAVAGYLSDVRRAIDWRGDDVTEAVPAAADVIASALASLDEVIERIEATDIETGVDAIGGSQVGEFFAAMKNPLIVDQEGRSYREESYFDIIERAKRKGFDGVIIQNTYDGGPLDDIFVAFDPTQIKSATGNRGTFDPADPRILHQSLTDGTAARGRVEFRPGAPTRIILGARADRSTPLHELGHIFLEDVFALSGRSERVAKEMDGIKAWWRGNAESLAAEATKVPLAQVRSEGRQWAVVEPGGRRSVHNNKASANTAAKAINDKSGTVTADQVAAFLDGDMQGTDPASLRIRTALHEQFARGFETYLMEGKAPSLALRDAFERFAQWLTRLYRRMKGDLGVALTDDMRAVFDAMLATDEELTAAREAAGAGAMFTTADATGLTEAEWGRYLETAEAARLEEQRRVRDAVVREVRRAESAEAQAERDAIREEVEAESRERPVFQAAAWLAGGEWIGPEGANPFGDGPHLRLSRDAVIGTIGREQAKALPRHRNRAVYATHGGETGIHPDQAAPVFGFDTGEAMLRAMLDAPSRDAWVKAETERRYRERHGDPLNDGTVEDLADEAVHSDARGRVLEAELRALGRKVGKAPTPRQAAQKAAERHVEGLPVSRALRADRFLAAERRAGEEAQRAFAAGDADAAYAAKLRQVANHHLYRAARRFRKDYEAGLSKAKRAMQAKPAGKVRASVQFDFHMAARFVFSQFGLATKPARFSFQEWRERLADHDPDVAAELQPTLNAATREARPYRDLSVEEFRELVDVANNLLTVGRNLEKTRLGREQVEIAEAQADLIGALEEFHGRKDKPVDLGAVDWKTRAGIWFGSAKAAMTRVTSYALSVDGSETGPMHRLLINPLQAAVNDYTAARDAMALTMRDLLHPLLRDRRGAIEAPELGGRFALKAEVLAAILHTGSESSRARLFEGWKAQGQAVTPDAWAAFQSRLVAEGVLTREDYQTVRKIWGLFADLRPKALAAYRSMYGKDFGFVEPAPVETPFGTIDGGYFPAMYDANKSPVGQRNQEVDLTNQTGLLGGFGGVDSFTKDRVSGTPKAPLNLNLEMLPAALDKELRFIHILPVARQISRIVNTATFKRAAHDVSPAFVEKLIVPWLQRSVSQQVTTVQTGGFGDTASRALSGARTLAAVHIMAGNIRNAIEQVTGLAPAGAVVGHGRLAGAVARHFAAPVQTTRWVHEMSPMMASRMGVAAQDAMDEARSLVREASKTGRFMNLLVRHSYVFQRMMVHVTEPAVWMAGYDRAIEQGMTEADAVLSADRLVNDTQGSGNPFFVSGLEVGPPVQRMALMFYSFFNATANRAMAQYRVKERDATLVRKAMAGLAVYASFVAVPALVSEALRVAFGGIEDDDGDGYADDLLAQAFWGQIGFVSAMVPIIGPAIATMAREGFDDGAYARYSLSPVTMIFERGGDVAGALGNIWSGEDLTPSQVKNAAKGALIWLPGGNYIGNMIGYAYAGHEVEGLGDAAAAYSTGRERRE